jgi:hypothetical protein
MTPLLQSQPVSVVVGLCLVAFLCVRQLRAQEVSETRGLRLMVVFGVLGAAQLMTALDADPVSTVALACVLASLMIEGALGGLRGARVAIYREGSQLMSGGNATTVALLDSRGSGALRYRSVREPHRHGLGRYLWRLPRDRSRAVPWSPEVRHP